MKLVLFFAFIVASANTFAQQAPGVMSGSPEPAPPMALPMPPPQPPQLSTAELSQLLRAQTTAIKFLSSRLDSLEERLRKIESEAR